MAARRDRRVAEPAASPGARHGPTCGQIMDGNFGRKMERAMRFELTTSTLARLRSTPELRPHPASRQYTEPCDRGKGRRQVF